MKRIALFLGVVAVIIVVSSIGVGALNGENHPSPLGAKPVPKTWTEAEWKVTTPYGWTRQDVTTTADAKKAVRYSNTAGDYVIVAIDPLGSGYAYDTLWTYAVKGNGFEIVRKLDCSGTTDESCSSSDARFDGYALWKTGTTPQKVNGHVWYFMFGNAKSTTVDPVTFETILESITVTA